MSSHRGHALRRGRCSLPGHGYLITAVTQDRSRWFEETANARAAARSFYADSVALEAETLAFVVMPDHVHWLLILNGDLSEAVRRYKSLVTHQVGARVWQRGFHDHGLRREEDLRRVCPLYRREPSQGGAGRQHSRLPLLGCRLAIAVSHCGSMALLPIADKSGSYGVGACAPPIADKSGSYGVGACAPLIADKSGSYGVGACAPLIADKSGSYGVGACLPLIADKSSSCGWQLGCAVGGTIASVLPCPLLFV